MSRNSSDQILLKPYLRSISIDLAKSEEFMGKMQNLNRLQLLQKIAFSYASREFQTEEGKKSLIQQFEIRDKENKGVLHIEDLQQIMMNFSQDKHHIKPLVQVLFEELKADIDENDFINYKKVIQCIEQQKDNSQHLQQAFNFMDEDGDGKVKIENMSPVIKRRQEVRELVEIMISEADTDGDGQISFNDFKTLIDGNES